METRPSSKARSGSQAPGAQTRVSPEVYPTAKVCGWLCLGKGVQETSCPVGGHLDGCGWRLEGVELFLQGGPALGAHPLSGQGLVEAPQPLPSSLVFTLASGEEWETPTGLEGRGKVGAGLLNWLLPPGNQAQPSRELQVFGIRVERSPVSGGPRRWKQAGKAVGKEI